MIVDFLGGCSSIPRHFISSIGRINLDLKNYYFWLDWTDTVLSTVLSQTVLSFSLYKFRDPQDEAIVKLKKNAAIIWDNGQHIVKYFAL